MFEDTKHLVRSAVDGYNVCIFAYGQTGSGEPPAMQVNLPVLAVAIHSLWQQCLQHGQATLKCAGVCAGKTHTMAGNPKAPGLAPRGVEELFRGAYSSATDVSHLRSLVSTRVLFIHTCTCGAHVTMVHHCNAVLNADARKASFSVSAYMLELYQDDLCDLLRPADTSRKGGEVCSSPMIVGKLGHLLCYRHVSSWIVWVNWGL